MMVWAIERDPQMTGPDYPTSPGDPGQYPATPPPPPGYGGQAPPPYPYPPQANPYGQPQPYAAAAYGYAAPQQGNGMAVAALVLGIVSLVLSWVPFFDWILGALAIIFGAIGMSAAKQRGGAGRGMAVAGLVLGIITVALGVLFVFWVFAVFNGVCGQPGVNCS